MRTQPVIGMMLPLRKNVSPSPSTHAASSPGRFAKVSKERLELNITDYQRDPTRTVGEVKVAKIVQNFNWEAFGVLDVFERDGRLFIYDGGHRWEATMRIPAITEVPCMIFTSRSVLEEARAHLAVNTLRKAMSATEKLKAQLTIHEPAALLVARLLAAAGREAGIRGPNGCRCIGLLYRLAKNSPETLMRVWPIIVKLTEGKELHEHIVESLHYLELKMSGDESLSDKKWTERILRIGLERLLQGAHRSAAAFSKGGSKRWAIGVYDEINKGLHYRLPVDISLSDE